MYKNSQLFILEAQFQYLEKLLSLISPKKWKRDEIFSQRQYPEQLQWGDRQLSETASASLFYPVFGTILINQKIKYNSKNKIMRMKECTKCFMTKIVARIKDPITKGGHENYKTKAIFNDYHLSFTQMLDNLNEYTINFFGICKLVIFKMDFINCVRESNWHKFEGR